MDLMKWRGQYSLFRRGQMNVSPTPEQLANFGADLISQDPTEQADFSLDPAKEITLLLCPFSALPAGL